MCGTPLPQPPITTPGAHSTLSFTRVPVDGPHTTPASTAHFDAMAPTAVEEAPASGVSAPEIGQPVSPRTPPAQPSATAVTRNYFSQAEEAQSLDQFIAGFHYTPPADEDEVTMTGDKPVLDTTAQYDQAAPVSVAEEQIPVVEPLVNVVEPPVKAIDLSPEEPAIIEEASSAEAAALEPPPFATKGVREPIPDQPVPERSGFLDLSEPPMQEVPSHRGSSIVGPSFLGLSDTPGNAAYVSGDGAAGRSHWRLWTAVIIIAIFGVLGVVEWRSEKGQSDNGPIGIMRMQINRLKGKKGAVITPPPASDATEAAPPISTVKPNGSGPEIQVAPQPKPHSTTAAPDNSAPVAKPAAPGAASNSPATTPAQSSAAAPAGTPSASGATAQPNTKAGPIKPQATSTEPAKGSAASGVPSAETAPAKPQAKPAPGAEELAKAANASDAAAASAWLWKSVAKGNPEAPVKLANMYIKGDGVPQSCEQALVLLRSSAAEQNAAARSRLGSLYATGTCVQRNRVRAYEYMSQAVEANPNAAWARDFKKQLWEQMTPQERAQAQTNR